MEEKSFINELKENAKDLSKVNTLLRDTKYFQTYLREMGMSDEFVENAAVVNLVRSRIKAIFLTEQCELSEKGIKHESGDFRVDENGNIQISDGETIFLPNKNGNIVFTRKKDVLNERLVINKYGAIDRYVSVGVSPYTGSYISYERDNENNTILIESSDGASYEEKDFVPDNGNPLSIKNSSNFEEDYNLLTNEFPKLKEWYDKKYPGININNEEFREIQEGKRVELLELEISEYMEMLSEKDTAKNNLSERYKKMMEFISAIGEKSPVGRIVATSIMKKNTVFEIPTKGEEREKEEKEEVSETTKQKVARLKKELKALKKQDKQSYAEIQSIKRAIDSLEYQISNVPVIGNRLLKRFNNQSKVVEPKSTSGAGGKTVEDTDDILK